jgi:propionyl-CoA synthetase
VCGINDELKGEIPLGFLVLNAGCARPEHAIVAECIGRIREHIGPVAAFRTATVVKRLPKTRSGKVLRGTMRRMANGEPWTMPATIDDPAALDEIGVALVALGFQPRSHGR